jgi:hypothetical protein
MVRRYRLIEWKNEEIYFSNGPQCGTFVVGVDTTVGDDGPCFRKADVVGIELSIVVGGEPISCRDHLPGLTTDWLATPGNLELLARRVERAEERDPTYRRGNWPIDRRGLSGGRW